MWTSPKTIAPFQVARAISIGARIPMQAKTGTAPAHSPAAGQQRPHRALDQARLARFVALLLGAAAMLVPATARGPAAHRGPLFSGLPRLDLFAQRPQIELRLARLRKHLVLFLLDVMFHVLAEHLDLRLPLRIADLAGLYLRDQFLRRRMLDLGLVHQVFVIDGLADGGIEDLFLDLGVQRQLLADSVCQLLLLCVAARALELVKHVLDAIVILHQQGAGIGLRSPPGSRAAAA